MSAKVNKMISSTGILSNRWSSAEYRETFVSVEKAADLQSISMQRFQRESANDIQLRRFLGHVSVNRRSTEILRTASFEEEIVAELEKESMYDEDAVWYDLGCPQQIPTFPESNITESTVNLMDDLADLPLLADSDLLADEADHDALEKYRPDASDVVELCADNKLLLNIDEDWMYDVLNLHIDNDIFTKAMTTRPLSKTVAIQFWKIIFASLAGIAHRKKQTASICDVDELEAYGLPNRGQLVGLGLHCDDKPHAGFDTRLRLVI